MFRPEGLEDVGPGRGAAVRNFTRVRDRLFYALFYKISHTYARCVPPFVRRCLEFVILFKALLAIGFLAYMHMAFSSAPVSCLDKFKDSWPNQDGVLRIEVVHNLTVSPIFLTRHPQVYTVESSCTDTDEACEDSRGSADASAPENSSEVCPVKSPQTSFYARPRFLRNPTQPRRILDVVVDNSEPELKDPDKSPEEEDEEADGPEFIFEYALEYGFLRLSDQVRSQLGVKVTTIQIDPDVDSCFGDGGLDRYIRSEIVGIEDLLRNSFKLLANKEDDKHGYLRNVKTDEHFKFISVHTTRSSYIAAAFVMVLFTLSISMLLRYSHHQIFVFIINVLQMLELNISMAFPAAPLLTVILALVGIEAIMSEFFSDSTTAFYIIIIVWVADQYEAICCHTPITRRYWLRFFYLYHFAFYAYHYRFNGQYSSLALVASWLLTQHSMLYFFHHYELPAVLHAHQLQTELGSHHPTRAAADSGGSAAAGGGSANPGSLEYIENLLEELLPTGQPPLTPQGSPVPFEANNNLPTTPDAPTAVLGGNSRSATLILYPVQNIILTHLMRFLHVVRTRSSSANPETTRGHRADPPAAAALGQRGDPAAAVGQTGSVVTETGGERVRDDSTIQSRAPDAIQGHAPPPPPARPSDDA